MHKPEVVPRWLRLSIFRDSHEVLELGFQTTGTYYSPQEHKGDRMKVFSAWCSLHAGSPVILHY